MTQDKNGLNSFYHKNIFDRKLFFIKNIFYDKIYLRLLLFLCDYVVSLLLSLARLIVKLAKLLKSGGVGSIVCSAIIKPMEFVIISSTAKTETNILTHTGLFIF